MRYKRPLVLFKQALEKRFGNGVNLIVDTGERFRVKYAPVLERNSQNANLGGCRGLKSVVLLTGFITFDIQSRSGRGSNGPAVMQRILSKFPQIVLRHSVFLTHSGSN